MGVVYIGDRATGKTSLAMELLNPKFNYVHCSNQSYNDLRGWLYDSENQVYKPTGNILGSRWNDNRYLEVEVDLPAGRRSISVDWLDTLGEMWVRSWGVDHPDLWPNVFRTVKNSDGIMLILHPYREMTGLKQEVKDDFSTQNQWCKRFERWVDFFLHECRQVRHVIICLHKADLFTNAQEEAARLAYSPHRSRMNWFERNSYITQRYFRPVRDQLATLNQSPGLSVRCFITSIYHRPLIELPWIYLASYLVS